MSTPASMTFTGEGVSTTLAPDERRPARGFASAPVAQRIRAPVSYTVGRRFESVQGLLPERELRPQREELRMSAHRVTVSDDGTTIAMLSDCGRQARLHSSQPGGFHR